MAFTRTDSLPEKPDVSVFFSGLLVLEPQDDNTCEVFVHASAPRHYLTIEVRRKEEGRPDELMMRHVGPLAFVEDEAEGQTPLHGMIISKSTDGAKSIRSFAPTTALADGAPEGLDLAINFESQAFHAGNPESGVDPVTKATFRLLDVDPLGGRPSILVDDGTFYTAAKTRPELRIILKQPDGTDRVLAPFASLIGAAISMSNQDDSVIVQWRQYGRLETLELKRDPGISYEIYVVNDPLYERDAVTDLTVDPKHDEFREYYKILNRVPTDKQFRLAVESPPPSTQPVPRGSTRTPCMAIIKSPGP